jgi:ribosomal protein L37AE/L43A
MPNMSNMVEQESIINDYCSFCGELKPLKKRMGYWTCESCVKSGDDWRSKWKRFCNGRTNSSGPK